MSIETKELLSKREETRKRRESLLLPITRESRAMTQREKAADDSLAAQVRVLDDVLDRVNDANRPARWSEASHSIEVRTPARPKGHLFAACLLSICGAQFSAKHTHEPLSPERWAKEKLGDHYAAAAISASSLAAGGGLIPQDVAEDLIEALIPLTAVRRAGARIEPMPAGNLSLNKILTAPVFGWVGEQAPPNAVAPVFGQSNLAAKKLRALIPISNEIFRFAGPRAVDNVLADVKRAMAYYEDLGFLRGAGGQYAPQGLLYQAQMAVAAGQQGGYSANSSASPTFTTVSADTSAMIQALLNANSRMISPTWIWAPRTSSALEGERSTLSGMRTWPEMERNYFRRYPFFETTSIPTNLNVVGSTNIDSEIYLADFADVVIGQGPIEVRRSDQAQYTDSSGAQQSAFVRDETLADVLEYVDLGVRHLGSLAILQGVEYTIGMN